MNDETKEAYASAARLTEAALVHLDEADTALRAASLALDKTGHRGADASTEHALSELAELFEHCLNDRKAFEALAAGGLCWCGESAECWNPETQATPAHASCWEHAHDGYMGL